MNKVFYAFLILLLGHQTSTFAQHDPTKKPADSTGHKLKEVTVSGKKKVRIKSDTLSGSLKIQQPLLYIPQNIVSISSELLQQQGVLELKDAARNASGVYFGYNSTPFDNSATLQIRGFTGYTTLNGMSRRFSYGASIDDESLISNIEFIKGPAGFLNSTGEPGGSVNIVTKTPGRQVFNVQEMAGSFNFYRVAADVGSEVQKKGFSYRFNTAYQHKDSYLDLLRTEKYVVAPVLQYNFSPNTYLIGEYNFIKGTTQNGSTTVKVRSEGEKLTGRIGDDFSAAIGLPNSYALNETGRLSFVHKFNQNWQLTSQSSYLSAPYTSWDMTSQGSVVNFDANGNTKRRTSYTLGTGHTFSTQLFLNGKFNTGKIQHQLLFGGDYTNSKDSLSLNRGTVQFDFNRYRPNYVVNSAEASKTVRTIRIENNTKLKSAFVYDNIRLQKQLLLTLGGRYTWYNNDRVNTTAKGKGTPQQYSQHAFSPRAALTFLVDTATSVFVLYDQSFIPQSGQTAIVNPATGEVTGSKAVDPQKGKDMELGMKRNWFNSRLSTTINGFHTLKTNVLVTDFVNAGYVKQIGQVTSNGIELDILGNITDHLSLSANYTYVNAKITKDVDTAQIGKELSQTPRQIFNTWLQYSFFLSNKGRLDISAGSISYLKRSTSEKGKYIPDFTKLDAAIAYTQDRYFIRCIADNLTGKRYMASGDIISDYPYPGRDYYYIDGEPFNVKISAGIKF